MGKREGVNMELKAAFESAEGITFEIGSARYSIHGTSLCISPANLKSTYISVIDMQTLSIREIMDFGVSEVHATILQWLATRYVQDVYPHLQ